MRLTCLKCGHRVEVIGATAGALPQACVCGAPLPPGLRLATHTEPDEALAEQTRERAFWAAGLVHNWGGYALGVSICGVLVFPLGLVGAIFGLFVLFFLRDPVRRYSGRVMAVWAVVAGLAIFLGEGSVVWSVWQRRVAASGRASQQAIGETLRALRHAELQHFATHSRFATFTELRKPSTSSLYTLYLRDDLYLDAQGPAGPVHVPLPPDMRPSLFRDHFAAVAVGNLDGDAALDVWRIDDAGTLSHPMDDLKSP